MKGRALITTRLHLVGLLGLRGLTCCCLEGLTIAVIVTAVQGVVGLVGAAVGLATLAKLLTATLLRGSNQSGPQMPCALSYSWLWIGLYQPLCVKFLGTQRGIKIHPLKKTNGDLFLV